MSRRTWEDVGIGVGALGLIAGGVYILDKQGLIHLPSFVHPSTTTTSHSSTTTSHSSSGLPALNVAPQTLPSSVPVRCGTVYVSFGPSPHDSNMIMVGKYTNAKLIDQYYQPATQSSSFNTAGAYAGGYQCGNTSTSSGGSGSSSAQSAAKGWADIGNGCYVAQSGATLGGLAAALGTSYYNLAKINGISNPNVIQIGQHVGYPNACSGSSGSSGGSGSPSRPSGFSCKYTVQSGDTLSGIAAKYNTSVSALMSANSFISNSGVIDIGWVLHVPCTSGSGSSGGSSGLQPVPSGYHYGGFLCGQALYIPNIPGSWPLSSAMPPVYNPDNVVWINVCRYTGGPTHYIKNAKTGADITNYSLVASYYGSTGKWSGNAEVVKNHFYGPSPFVANRSATYNWGTDVCGQVT